MMMASQHLFAHPCISASSCRLQLVVRRSYTLQTSQFGSQSPKQCFTTPNRLTTRRQHFGTTTTLQEEPRWTTAELAATTMALVLCSGGAFWYSGNSTNSGFRVNTDNNNSNNPNHSPGGNTLMLAAPLFDESDEQSEDTATDGIDNNEKMLYDVSVRALKGGRLYMEDEYFVGDRGRFVGVFDGHGGGDVSYYLRTHLYQRFKLELKQRHREEKDDYSLTRIRRKKPSLSSRVAALRAAFEDTELRVLSRQDMQYQGSTAVAVTIHEADDGSRTLLSANVGDSRAILSRKGKAVELTRDHKPSDERERARILAMGEKVEWDNYAKVHRVKNLSLSRAIGDRFAKPAVSSEVEIKHFPLRENDDEFIVVASDGLWDVMTSEQAVSFVSKKMDTLTMNDANSMEGGEIGKRLQDARRKNMSRYLANEAMRRGTGDNVCVVILWLQQKQT